MKVYDQCRQILWCSEKMSHWLYRFGKSKNVFDRIDIIQIDKGDISMILFNLKYLSWFFRKWAPTTEEINSTWPCKGLGKPASMLDDSPGTLDSNLTQNSAVSDDQNTCGNQLWPRNASLNNILALICRIIFFWLLV